jgi:hypothetical protein
MRGVCLHDLLYMLLPQYCLPDTLLRRMLKNGRVSLTAISGSMVLPLSCMHFIWRHGEFQKSIFLLLPLLLPYHACLPPLQDDSPGTSGLGRSSRLGTGLDRTSFRDTLGGIRDSVFGGEGGASPLDTDFSISAGGSLTVSDGEVSVASALATAAGEGAGSGIGVGTRPGAATADGEAEGDGASNTRTFAGVGGLLG